VGNDRCDEDGSWKLLKC